MFSRQNALRSLTLTLALVAGTAPLVAQSTSVARIEARPASLGVTVGEAAALELVTFDQNGNRVEAEVSLVGPRNGVNVVTWFQDGTVEGVAPGEYNPRWRWPGLLDPRCSP